MKMAKTMKQWKVTGKGGFDDLKFDDKAPVPEVGDKDVLVKRTLIRADSKATQLTYIKSTPHH